MLLTMTTDAHARLCVRVDTSLVHSTQNTVGSEATRHEHLQRCVRTTTERRESCGTFETCTPLCKRARFGGGRLGSIETSGACLALQPRAACPPGLHTHP